MHVHLPKPLHGWREFSGEVGIIVLGVLIALAAEQVVEQWRWHEKVAVIRKSLLGELGNDRARWHENMSFVPCARREIAALQQWAAQGRPGVAPPQTPVTFKSLFWLMHSANWNLAVASGTLDHFPISEQLDFAALYDGIAHRQIDLQNATDLSQEVESLVPLATNDEGRRDLVKILGRLSSKIDALTDNDD